MSDTDPTSGWTEGRRPDRRGLAIIVAAWVAACVAWLSVGLVRPDGAGYWSWLPSALEDGDLLLFDEWQALGMASDGRFEHQWITPTGHLSNHWGPGAAIAWAPGYLAASLTARLPPLREMPRDGMRLPHVAAGNASDALLALVAALVALAVARRFGDERSARLAALGLLFGTPLLYYGLRSGMAPHAAASAASLLALHLALKLRDAPAPPSAFASGLACGFGFAIRPQLAALAALPLVLVPWREWRRPRLSLAFGAGCVLGALPQLVVSAFVYGSVLGAMAGGPSPEGRPYAAFERFWTWEPWLSAWHGALPWTPFVIIGLAGLALLWRRDARLLLACALLAATQAFAIAALDRPFWGAHAFGQRRLDALAGIVVLGAALLLSRLPRALGVALTLACCAWTTALYLASWNVLPMNAPVSWADLGRSAAEILTSPGAWARPLAAVPGEHRPVAAVALLGAGALLGLLLLALSRLRPGLRVALGAAWLATCSAWLLACGLRGSERLPAWREAAERHRALGPMQGSVLARIEMLRQEARWYRLRGDEREAAAVDARADSYQRRFDAALVGRE